MGSIALIKGVSDNFLYFQSWNLPNLNLLERLFKLLLGLLPF